MDSLKCQTSTVSPAEPGDFPILVNRDGFHTFKIMYPAEDGKIERTGALLGQNDRGQAIQRGLKREKRKSGGAIRPKTLNAVCVPT